MWKQLSQSPFPRVKTFQLEDSDFDRVMVLRRCKEDELREIEEWNTILTSEGTDACVFNTDEIPGIEYVILVRENSYHNLADILKHELSHIAKGDL